MNLCQLNELLRNLSCFSLKAEFSSYEKFLKFVVTFDLRSLVIDGKIPFTTQRVIGTCVRYVYLMKATEVKMLKVHVIDFTH